MQNPGKRPFALVLTVILLSGLLPGGTLCAEESKAGIDEERLVQRLKREIMQELREGEFLKKEIEAGIQEYVASHADARAKARAERAHKASENAKNVRRVSAGRDHILGDPRAKVSLIEYSDFECPYCKRFHGTPGELVEAYEGDINWVYRHFPLGFHNPGAQKQAEASECAAELGGNEAFWKFTDIIYARTKSNGNGFPLNELVPLAEEIGLDANAFGECLDSGKHSARVTEDFEEAVKIGITGTPTSIILNAETGEAELISGAVPVERLRKAIDKLLR